MCGAKSIVDIDVAKFSERRAECIDVFLIRLDLQQFHARSWVDQAFDFLSLLSDLRTSVGNLLTFVTSWVETLCSNVS